MTNVSTRWMTLTAFLFISLVVALLMLRHASAAGAPKVEYRVSEDMSMDNNKLEAELKEYGSGGWELVLIVTGNVTRPAPKFIFKRVERP